MCYLLWFIYTTICCYQCFYSRNILKLNTCVIIQDTLYIHTQYSWFYPSIYFWCYYILFRAPSHNHFVFLQQLYTIMPIVTTLYFHFCTITLYLTKLRKYYFLRKSPIWCYIRQNCLIVIRYNRYRYTITKFPLVQTIYSHIVKENSKYFQMVVIFSKMLRSFWCNFQANVTRHIFKT